MFKISTQWTRQGVIFASWFNSKFLCHGSIANGFVLFLVWKRVKEGVEPTALQSHWGVLSLSPFSVFTTSLYSFFLPILALYCGLIHFPLWHFSLSLSLSVTAWCHRVSRPSIILLWRHKGYPSVPGHLWSLHIWLLDWSSSSSAAVRHWSILTLSLHLDLPLQTPIPHWDYPLIRWGILICQLFSSLAMSKLTHIQTSQQDIPFVSVVYFFSIGWETRTPCYEETKKIELSSIFHSSACPL